MTREAAPLVPFLVRFPLCAVDDASNATAADADAPAADNLRRFGLCGGMAQSVTLPPALLAAGQQYEPVFFLSSGVRDGTLSFGAKIGETATRLLDAVRLDALVQSRRAIPGSLRVHIVDAGPDADETCLGI